MAEPKFEKDLERLEKTVEALEAGGLSLDDALKRFEEGIKLARRCEKALTEAERKIEILVKKANGEVAAAPFLEEAEGAEAGEGEDEGEEEEEPETGEEEPETGKEEPETGEEEMLF